MRGTPLERFEAKYIPEPNSGCWLWLGSASGRLGNMARIKKINTKVVI